MGIMSFRKGLMKDAGVAAAVGKALLFIPLAKIDEAEQTVTGVVTAEVLDKSGEVFHYETSKPYFKAWSENFARVTKGKSLGNVRAMHQPNAVGKLTDLTFDDANKTITATAKIVDASEWAKVTEGVYTGFSIGGSYVKQWEDGETKKNYFTADPVEVSIVDNPCVPVAHFTATKADGVEEQRPFKLYEPSNEEVAKKATELAGDKNWIDFIDQAREDLKKEHGIPDFSKTTYAAEDDAEKGDKSAADAEGAEEDDAEKKKKAKKKEGEEAEADDDDAEEGDAEKAAAAAVEQVWKATDGQTFSKKADCVAHQATIKPAEPENPVEKALKDADEKLKKAEAVTKPYGDVAYAIEKGGVSLFPIDSEFHIRSSWVFANKSTTLTEDEKKTALEKIKAAWVEKIGGEPPTAEQIEAFNGAKAREATKALGITNELEKSFWIVGMWCRIVDEVLCASDCMNWCHPDTDLPQTTKDICAAILTFMIQLVEAEVACSMARLDKTARPEALEGFAKFLAGAIDSVAPVEEIVEKTAMTKLQTELDALKATNETQAKQIVQAVEGIGQLTEKLSKYLDQPEPRRGAAKAVNKEGDRNPGASGTPANEDALKKLIEEHGQEGVAKMVIRLAQQNPISVTGR